MTGGLTLRSELVLQPRSTRTFIDAYLLLVAELIPATSNENTATPSSITKVLIDTVPAVGGNELTMFSAKTTAESPRPAAYRASIIKFFVSNLFSS